MSFGPIEDLLAVRSSDDGDIRFELRRSLREVGELTFDVRVCDREQEREGWIVRSAGLVEDRISLGRRGELLHARRHELLIDHQEHREELQFYGGAPTDPDRVVSELQRAHHQVVGAWRPMSRYVSRAFSLPKAFRYPAATLAKGPKSLMRSYSSALEANGVSTNLADLGLPRHQTPSGWIETDPDLDLLVFCPEALYRHRRGEPPPSFVIARRIVCERTE